MNQGLRILLHGCDPVRRRGLVAMLEGVGHTLVSETPDVVLCDLTQDAVPPGEVDAPVVVLTDRALRGEQPAGVIRHDITAAQLDLALRAVAAGLLVRAPSAQPSDGFIAASEDVPPLVTPREAEILALIGQGMSNKAVARALGISVHTVKFHLEALFAKLDATSRAEAVAKGLRGGIIEL